MAEGPQPCISGWAMGYSSFKLLVSRSLGPMANSSNSAITDILMAIRERPDQSDELREALYDQAYPHLREVAGRLMSGERSGHTLQPTALVHEAFVVLVDQRRVDWQCRAQFMAVAARIMRRILIDYARRQARLKRGGDFRRVTLDEQIAQAEFGPLELIVLDETLQRLEEVGLRIAQVVERRVFGGMTMEAIASSLGVSVRTVQEDWSFGRRWLAREYREHGKARE